MDDSKPVEQALNEAGIEVVDQEPDASGELADDEDKVGPVMVTTAAAATE